MSTILLVDPDIIFGEAGDLRHGCYGGAGRGVLGIVLIVLVVLWLVGR